MIAAMARIFAAFSVVSGSETMKPNVDAAIAGRSLSHGFMQRKIASVAGLKIDIRQSNYRDHPCMPLSSEAGRLARMRKDSFLTPRYKGSCS
jgi:hypothetical protein